MSEHEPVMVEEAVGHLAPARGGVFLDCTAGLGGHTLVLVEGGASRVVALDRDAQALVRARARLGEAVARVDLVHADYRRFDDVLRGLGVERVDGVLADLGVSSLQLDAPGRGFSFRRDEPLDMRMDSTTGATAAEMIAAVDEGTLADVIYGFGEERHARRVARAVIAARARAPIATTGQLAAIVRRAIPRRGYTRIDPATRTFQAIRVWVNHELEGLDDFLTRVAAWLAPGGRLVVLTFQSQEDRVVKHTLRALQAAGALTIRTKRPMVPTDAEIARNPRARSAKLRAAERPA